MPDELDDWVRGVIANIDNEFNVIVDKINIAYAAVEGLTLKEQVSKLYSEYKDVAGFTIARIKGQDSTEQILRLCEPKHSIPFINNKE